MFDLNHILTPLDASEASLSAMKIGEQLAQAYSATLHTVHVVPPIPTVLQRVLFPYAGMGEDVTELEHELVGFARSEIKRLLPQRDNDPAGHPHTVLSGEVIEGIHEEIQRVGPDLVVMAAQSQSRHHSGHLGSTCRVLLNTWDGPILISRHDLTGPPLQRITIVTDFANHSEKLFSVGFGLALRLNLPVTILTVIADPRILDRGGLLRATLKIEPKSLLSKGKRAAEKHLERIMKQLPVPFPERSATQLAEPELIVTFGDPRTEIQTHAGSHEGTLLIIGRSHPEQTTNPTLGSMAESILNWVPSHGLVVPIPASEHIER